MMQAMQANTQAIEKLVKALGRDGQGAGGGGRGVDRNGNSVT
jgi:hypothetical protein